MPKGWDRIAVIVQLYYRPNQVEATQSSHLARIKSAVRRGLWVGVRQAEVNFRRWLGATHIRKWVQLWKPILHSSRAGDCGEPQDDQTQSQIQAHQKNLPALESLGFRNLLSVSQAQGGSLHGRQDAPSQVS